MIGRFCLALLACAFGCSAAGENAADAKRPYEMVWAKRTHDDQPPLERMESAEGWRVEGAHAVARAESATDRALFGTGVLRLVYRATGKNPQVKLRLASPRRLEAPFDTLSLWVYGNNVYYVKNNTPSTTLVADFLDSDGQPFSVRLLHIHHLEWFLARVKLDAAQRARVARGATFLGFTLTGGTNTEDRTLDLTSFCAFTEELKPLAFKPRAQRPNRVYPEVSAGTNTGAGELPFPTTPQTIVPATEPTPALELCAPTAASAWDTLAFRWQGGAWQHVARGGGVWFAAAGAAAARATPVATTVVTNAVAPLDLALTDTFADGSTVRTRVHQEGRALVLDVATDRLDVESVRFGAWDIDDEPQRITLPYYTYGHGAGDRRPGVLMTQQGGLPFFHMAHVDWTQSNASEPYSLGACEDGTVAANGGVRYFAKTDGAKNVCRERFVYLFSDRVADVLPAIPNPPSPWKQVTGSGVWRSHGVSPVRANDLAYWRQVRARGLKHLIVTDHEVCWRDGNESFTFRTRAAPKKGGDQGQYDYTRTMIDELGIVYGPYNNFTDFAPVNGHWSPDRVSRQRNGQLQHAWNRCYAPKPAYAVEACAELTPIVQQKFRFNTAYCDVHTAVTPWERCDYDARVPGAGTFAAVFYAFGEIMMIQKANWKGPVYSEGNNHFLYCGLTDGNYAQDQTYRPADNPWLVDFDLLRLHPLCCNFGMGNEGMFYPGDSAPKDPDVRADRLLAATVAFGHPGFFLHGRVYEDRSYFMIQALAARYTQAAAETIRYVDAAGRALPTEAALANGAYRRSQIAVTYDDGTFVAANGSKTEPMRVPGVKDLWLPPNGYCGWTRDGQVLVYSGLVDGCRVDYAVSPEYVFMDGRGHETSFPGGTAKGAVIRLAEKGTANWPRPTPEDFAARSKPTAEMMQALKPAPTNERPLPYLHTVGMTLRGEAPIALDPATGAYAHEDRIACGGVSKEGFRMHPPWQDARRGDVFVQYRFTLPTRPLTFTACVGKADGSDSGDGILYRVVLIDAQGVEHELARTTVTEHVWTPLTADLSRWAGEKVALRLASDPGERNDTVGDWACWGDLKLLFSEDFFAPPQTTLAADEPIRVLDLSSLARVDLNDAAATRAAWDALHLAASLQGNVNRKGPRLFLRFLAETDDFWFDYCTGASGWLKGRPVERFAGVDGLLALVGVYAREVNGLVVYGEKPYALSNVASTLAGAERRLAIRKDEAEGSLYRRLLAAPQRPRDVLDLTAQPLVPSTGSCGSPKNDAYRWAKERCLDKGLCSPAFMAYYIDAYYLTDAGGGGAFSNSTLSNHDFYIANGAFFFDLDPWGDEIPNDEPGQPKGSDRATLVSLLKAQCVRAEGRNFIIGGFPPWAWKYADRQHRFDAPDGRRHPVATEWEYARLISSYNAMKDADALSFSGLANASFYRFFPLKDRYAQTAPAPDDAALRAQGLLKADGSVADKIYLTWYMGDYDAAAWLNTFAPQWWRDPARGQTLGSWAFDPILSVRVPQAVHYVRTEASARDWFIAGDNGFGYLMPSSLSAPRLDSSVPDGWPAWSALNRAAYRRFDLGISGFVIDSGDAAAKRRIADEYARFSCEGFVSDEGQAPGEVRLARGVPYVKMYLDLYGEPPQAAAQLADLFSKEHGTKFLMVRTILKSPSWHADVTKQLLEKTGDRVMVLDPRSFFRLARAHAGLHP